MPCIFKTEYVFNLEGEKTFYLENYMNVMYKTFLIFSSFHTFVFFFFFLSVLPFPVVSSFIIHFLLKRTFVCFAWQVRCDVIIHLYIQQNNVYSILVW
jgi:hypothetical protein